MNKFDPVALRQALEAASQYAKAGIQFVPVVVTSEADAQALWALTAQRLERMAIAAEVTTETVDRFTSQVRGVFSAKDPCVQQIPRGARTGRSPTEPNWQELPKP